VNLKRIASRVQRKETARALWCRARLPEHSIILTNVGRLEFSGDYGLLAIDKLFFVANVEPIFESQDNWILGSVTYRGQLFLTLWYLEELVERATASRVLAEMKKMLLSL